MNPPHAPFPGHRFAEACEDCDLEEAPGAPEPAAIVIFGATGDLAARKIVPALYNLCRAGRFHPASRIIAVGRRALTTPAFRESLAEATRSFSHTGFDEGIWNELALRLDYLEGDLGAASLYESLARLLAAPGMPAIRLFYLAVGPDQFSPVAAGLARAGLGSAGRLRGPVDRIGRLVVEKPYGSDLESARTLTRELHDAFAERDIFRIDHYLGKETVQNLLYFRFANSVFEPLWNRNYIESVEIEVLETSGIGNRGGYYDGAGAARDMLQNHLVQLLCLTAMEPPSSLDPEALRDEKVKVLRALPRYGAEDFLARSLRGRYTASGAIPDYLSEAKVSPGSSTETYVALKLELDNWRFAGVPFFLRTGKALDRQVSEIRVHFRSPPQKLFSMPAGSHLAQNMLTLRIQPDEGMWFSFNAKVPGFSRVTRSELRFSYRETDRYFPEAYERLIDDVIAGDSTLFIRSDEAEAAWGLVDGLESAWRSPGAPPIRDYAAGSPPPTFAEEAER
ncbi:MAG: glucose-6-phosphate dehydrogenase [Spirochaetota bacterium]